MNELKRAVFLDRDGVINEKAPEGGYVTRWDDFRFLPGVTEGIAALSRAGFHVIVVTNQRCVAKGLVGEADLKRLHEQMVESLAKDGAILEAVFYCPHDFEPPCDCRKPEPGMLLEAARTLHLDVRSSWMIGDSLSDVEAGRRAGCKTILMTDEESPNYVNRSDLIAANFLQAVRQLLSAEPAASVPDLPTIQNTHR